MDIQVYAVGHFVVDVHSPKLDCHSKSYCFIAKNRDINPWAYTGYTVKKCLIFICDFALKVQITVSQLGYVLYLPTYIYLLFEFLFLEK